MSFRFPSLLLIGLAWVCHCGATERTVLGVVYKDEPVSFDLTFANAGPSSVALGEIKASCDCLTVVSQPTTVASGATAKISCRYRSAKPGRIAVDVVVMAASASAAPLAVFAVTGFVADKSWLLSPEEVASHMGDFSFVDTRTSARFAGVHIPRALNMPAFALKTRTDLKTQKIVLVDDGFEPSSLLAETVSFHAQGFGQVFILDGGMASWIRQGHAVEGLNTAVKALAVTEISPADFFRARSDGVWQGVGIGPAPASKVPGLFPAGLMQAEHARDVGSVLTALPIMRESGGRILVISSEATMPADIEAHISKDVHTPIYYLKGGVLALEAYRAEQAALAVNTGQTFQTKPSRRTPIVSGACGSCGK